MSLFRIYANGCGIAETPLYTKEFPSKMEALQAAYEEAVNDYRSLEGSNGLLDKEDCRKLLTASSNKIPTEAEVNERYLQEIESWISYFVRLVPTDLD